MKTTTLTISVVLIFSSSILQANGGDASASEIRKFPCPPAAFSESADVYSSHEIIDGKDVYTYSVVSENSPKKIKSRIWNLKIKGVKIENIIDYRGWDICVYYKRNEALVCGPSLISANNNEVRVVGRHSPGVARFSVKSIQENYSPISLDVINSIKKNYIMSESEVYETIQENIARDCPNSSVSNDGNSITGVVIGPSGGEIRTAELSGKMAALGATFAKTKLQGIPPILSSDISMRSRIESEEFIDSAGKKYYGSRYIETSDSSASRLAINIDDAVEKISDCRIRGVIYEIPDGKNTARLQIGVKFVDKKCDEQAEASFSIP